MSTKKVTPVKKTPHPNQFTKAREREKAKELLDKIAADKEQEEKNRISTSTTSASNVTAMSIISESDCPPKERIVEKSLTEKLYDLLKYESVREQTLALSAIIQRLDADRRRAVETNEGNLSDVSRDLITSKNNRESFLHAITNATQNI